MAALREEVDGGESVMKIAPAATKSGTSRSRSRRTAVNEGWTMSERRWEIKEDVQGAGDALSVCQAPRLGRVKQAWPLAREKSCMGVGRLGMGTAACDDSGRGRHSPGPGRFLVRPWSDYGRLELRDARRRVAGDALMLC
jgi:hypothetical protein